MKTVITFGTFDLFHVGHLRLLERARSFGDRLVVGVSTDELNLRKKGQLPVVEYAARSRIVGALRVVDAVFPEESLAEKEKYLRDWFADVLVMGDDWQGEFDHLSHICAIEYLSRTPSISTTALRVEICTRGAVAQ